MTRFFSMRIAPGVRLSASPRGLRAHVGPRGARVHVGGGRTGVSTGAGPFTLYEPAGGPRRRSPRSTGPTRSQVNAAEKEQRADLAREALAAIDALHRQEFPAQTRPVAVAGPVADLATLTAAEERKALEGIGLFHRAERRDARERARTEAARQAARLAEEAETARRAREREIDAFWTLLDRNDRDAVVSMLSQVFADNEAPATAVGVVDGEVQLAVLVPEAGTVLPERVPATTPAGNLSLRTMSRSDVAEWDRRLVAGHLLATVREALASVQSLGSAAVVAMRDQGPDVYGRPRVVPLLAARFTRERLDGVRWADASSWDVVTQAGTDVTVNLRGSVRSLEPLDLAGEPDLAALVAAVDVDEVT